MKTILGIVVLALIIGGGYYFMNNNKSNTNDQSQNTSGSNNTAETPTPTPAPTPAASPTVSDHPVATIETSMGTIKVTLDHTAAPKTVENFVKLSNEGFYNNLTFHRISQGPGFHLIQGGDPKGDGTGGPGYTIPAEIKLKHTKGAIATARLGDEVNPTKASSGSQFYITGEAIPQLDGNYTVFGYVTSGMDVVEKINNVPTEPGDIPLTVVTIKKITITE